MNCYKNIFSEFKRIIELQCTAPNLGMRLDASTLKCAPTFNHGESSIYHHQKTTIHEITTRKLAVFGGHHISDVQLKQSRRLLRYSGMQN